MRMRFHSVWLCLGIGAIFLLVLGLTACAAPAATPVTVSPVVSATAMAQDEYQVLVTLMAPVLAGSNPITLQLRDVKTGKPLHVGSVRVAVAEKKPTAPVKDDHASDKKDPHATAKPDNHGNEKKDTHETVQVATHETGIKDTHGTAKVDDHASEKKEASTTEVKSTSHTDEEAGHAGKPLTAGKTEGEYVGQVIFPNAGEWLLNVSYEIEGKEKMTMFAVNATRSAETWLVLSGFLGVNLAVIATAGITKRKSLKK